MLWFASTRPAAAASLPTPPAKGYQASQTKNHRTKYCGEGEQRNLFPFFISGSILKRILSIPSNDVNCHCLAVFCQPAPRKTSRHRVPLDTSVETKAVFQVAILTKVTRGFGFAHAT